MRKQQESRRRTVDAATLDDRQQVEAGDDAGAEAPQDGSSIIIGRILARTQTLRVLVADDHRDCADSLILLVRLWGHEARVAYDAAGARRLAFEYEPDVLLLDIGMPGTDGYALARCVRQEPRLEDALMIAVTGYADEGHRLLGEASGFDHYLVKPLEPADLEVLLRLEKERLADSARGAAGGETGNGNRNRKP